MNRRLNIRPINEESLRQLIGKKSKERNIMKTIDLPISKLSFAEKLELMEKLWADLTRDERKFKSPAWHEAVLKDREEAYEAGKVTASDWEHVKKRMKKKVL
jgi:putative addiction module component (TIGR02574 family)